MIKREKKEKKEEGEEGESCFFFFSFVLPPGDVYQERHGGSDMKGIQVSIDVSESEIVPKAFQRPAVSGVRPECVFCGRQAKKISSHSHGGGRRGGGDKKCVKNAFGFPGG